MKKGTYLLTLLLALAVFGSMPIWGSGSSAAAEQAPVWDYEQDFTDAGKVNEDFDAFYLSKFMGSLSEETVAQTAGTGSHWTLGDGVLRRQEHVGVAYNADSIAMLSLTTRKFANFVMQVDVRQGDATTFWSGFAIRQDAAGKHFFEDGQVFYAEWDGNVKTWGQGLHGGPFLCGKIEAYDRAAWYTYTVTVDGNRMTVETVKANADEAPTSITVRLPWKFYKQGYITLMSINNNSMFRNFKVRALANTAAAGSDFDLDQQVPAADGADSLDQMAGESKDGPVMDVPPINYGQPAPDQKGCGAAAGASGTTLALTAAGISVLLLGVRYKRRRRVR